MITAIAVGLLGGTVIGLGVVGENDDLVVGGLILTGFSVLAGLAWAWRVKR